jgi:hypothetical protein
VAVKYLFDGSDPLSASAHAMAAEAIVDDDELLPEVGAQTFAYDREWVVTRIDHEDGDTVVRWSPATSDDI